MFDTDLNVDILWYRFIRDTLLQQGKREGAADLMMDRLAVGRQVDKFVSCDGQRLFILDDTPGSELTMSVNGQSQYQDRDFQVVGREVRWISPDFDLQVGDLIQMIYSPAYGGWR